MAHSSWLDFPHLIEELDEDGNEDLFYRGNKVKPTDVTVTTSKKLDWICTHCGHKWKASGDNRARGGTGCPACANQVIHSDGRNSMAKTHPELAKEYQGDANRVIAGTNKKLDWRCNICEHEWRTSGSQRVGKNRGCPACANQVIHSDGRNSMAKTHPELAKEYQGDANRVIAGTNKKLDWKCSVCSHEWNATGNHRIRGKGCPACANRDIHIDGSNSMAATHPNLAKEYLADATKVIAGTAKKLDWKCSVCSHEWNATGNHRIRGWGCPACANKEIHVDGSNSMATTHPNLAKEYLGDATKVIAGTHKKLDWKCSVCDGLWKSLGNTRVQGGGCPYCANQTVHPDGRNSMAETHPELAVEYIGNPNNVIAGTNKKLDWQCHVCLHEWRATGSHRVNGRGCPVCAPTGFQPDLPAVYYVIEIQNEEGQVIMYKGGISGDFNARFSSHKTIFAGNDRSKKWILKKVEMIDFKAGSEARILETMLLKVQEIRAPNIQGVSKELFLQNPLDYARSEGWI